MSGTQTHTIERDGFRTCQTYREFIDGKRKESGMHGFDPVFMPDQVIV